MPRGSGISLIRRLRSSNQVPPKRRVGVPALILGSGKQIGELVAVQQRLGAWVPPRTSHPRRRVADGEVLVLEPAEP